MVKNWIATGPKPPRGVIGDWQSSDWAISFADRPLFETFRKLTPVQFVCPCHYGAACEVGQLTVLSMGRDDVILHGRVLRNHSLVRTRFSGFDFMPAKCPRDAAAGYMVRASDDQWKYVVSKRHTFVFLQALDAPFGCFFRRPWGVAGSGVQACRHFIWLDLFPWAVQCRLFWELCRRLTFPLSLHLQLIGRTFVWWQTIIRLECVGGPDDWEQLPEKLVSLLRDNQIVDACSGLSSSRLSGIGCMHFALLMKVSTLHVFRAWSSGRLCTCNPDDFFRHNDNGQGAMALCAPHLGKGSVTPHDCALNSVKSWIVASPCGLVISPLVGI